MKTKYSIITANYNGFKLMKKYFECLENQSFKDFEVIIIDDCSTDNSFNNINDYIKNSTLNIKLFKTSKNSGPGVARNIGIEYAKGDYITFVDNDDWIEFNCLEEIDRIQREKNYDCIIYDYSMDFENGKRINCSSMYGDFDGEINKIDAIKYVRNHSVCKVYRKEIIKQNKLYYPQIKRHEDIAFVGSVLINCNTFYYLKKVLYHYIQIKKSLSRNNNIEEETIDIAYKILKTNYGKKYENELKEKSVMDLLYNKLLIMCKKNENNKKIKQFIEAYNENNSNWFNYRIINYIGKSKKIFLKIASKKKVTLIKLLAFAHSILGG